MRRLVLLVAPYRTATDAEREAVRMAKRQVLEEGGIPLFLPHALADVLDDEDPDQRDVALSCARSFAAHLAAAGESAELRVVGGRWTEGMILEAGVWDAVRSAAAQER